MELEQLHIQTDAITGFSYAFAKQLLDRLNSIMQEDRLYEISATYGTTTSLCNNLIHYLSQQIPGVEWDKIENLTNRPAAFWNDVKTAKTDIREIAKKYIDEGYDFLATFEPKK